MFTSSRLTSTHYRVRIILCASSCCPSVESNPWRSGRMQVPNDAHRPQQSTYTGVYARGGPTNVDPSKDLSALLDRSPADVRGIKKPANASQNDPPPAAAALPGRPPVRQACWSLTLHEKKGAIIERVAKTCRTPLSCVPLAAHVMSKPGAIC